MSDCEFRKPTFVQQQRFRFTVSLACAGEPPPQSRGIRYSVGAWRLIVVALPVRH
jgi:hypothetical protein